MSHLSSYAARALAVAAAFCISASAFSQSEMPQNESSAADNQEWFASASAGTVLAFGDDSYNVFSDFGDAAGWAFSLSGGKNFSKRIGVRVDARMMKMYSRVNLETYDALHDAHPDLFPRHGFYGYNVFALQAEAMVYLVNHRINADRKLYVYLHGGLGFNTAWGYDKHVRDWSHASTNIEGGWYEIDDSSHTMLAVPVGVGVQYRFSRRFGLNFEATCTFTGDKLEGVKYEENYDAYVTATLGAVWYF